MGIHGPRKMNILLPKIGQEVVETKGDSLIDRYKSKEGDVMILENKKPFWSEGYTILNVYNNYYRSTMLHLKF